MMNFVPNFMPLPNNVISNDMEFINQILNRLNDYEERIKKLEQRITRLENGENDNYNEPEKFLYMI